MSYGTGENEDGQPPLFPATLRVAPWSAPFAICMTDGWTVRAEHLACPSIRRPSVRPRGPVPDDGDVEREKERVGRTDGRTDR